MSWAIPVPKAATEGHYLTEAMVRAVGVFETEYLAAHERPVPTEVWAQVDAARAAVVEVVNSGALGTGEVTVVMSGHANPRAGRPPAPYIPDALTIAITRTTPSPAQAAADTYGGTADTGT